MNQISSLGVGSGLDLTSLVNQLVAAERAPTQNRLNRDQAKANAQLSAFGSVKSAAAKLKSALDELGGAGLTMRGSSSQAERVAVQVGSGAEAGRYRIEVGALASAQSLASSVFADADATLGEGTLTISVGDESLAIEVGGEVTSLRDVRDAINAGEVPVQAAVVADGDGFRLLLTARETGASATIGVTVDGTLDANLASAAMTETAAGQDAVYSINGLELTSASNQLDELLPGVSLTLLGVTGEGEGVDVVVEPDRNALKAKLRNLVSAYNGLVGVIGTTGRVDPEGDSPGALVGNAALRSLQSRISGVFSAPLADGDGAGLGSLLGIGFRTDLAGKVSLDDAALDEALSAGEARVEALASAFATSLGEALAGYTGSGGLIDGRMSGLNAQLERVARQREALDARMEQVEARLRAQFGALDALISQFQRTSGYLESQLASLANLRPKG